MSPENLAQHFRESYFTSATANMTPLAKVYLRTYINNTTNLPILSAFVERVLVVAQTAKDRQFTLAQTTLADLDTGDKLEGTDLALTFHFDHAWS